MRSIRGKGGAIIPRGDGILKAENGDARRVPGGEAFVESRVLRLASAWQNGNGHMDTMDMMDKMDRMDEIDRIYRIHRILDCSSQNQPRPGEIN